MPFSKAHASKGLKKIMAYYRAGQWSPYGDKGAILYSRGEEVAKIGNIRDWLEDHPELFSSDSEYRRLTGRNPTTKSQQRELRKLAKKLKKATGHRPQATGKNPRKQVTYEKLSRQYERALEAYAGGKRTPKHLRKIESLRKRLVRAGSRRYNPTRKQARRRKKARKMIRALLHIQGRKNPLPALISGLGPAITEGTGFAVGELGVSELAKGSRGRKSVSNKKSKTRRGGKKSKKSKGRRESAYREYKRTGRHRGSKGKRKSKNPPRRVKRITHAVAIGRRIVDWGTHEQMKQKQERLRRAGYRGVRIGKRDA